LEKLLQQFDDETVQVLLLCRCSPMRNKLNPNVVKVCVDNGTMPCTSAAAHSVPAQQAAPFLLQHVGVYAFPQTNLLDFTTWPVSCWKMLKSWSSCATSKTAFHPDGAG
jgi:CMP-2-keto-3-deoxyoctulosonic acid synthetase